MKFRALKVATDWPWVEQHIGAALMVNTTGIVAERDGELVAAVVLDAWTPNGCAVHIGSTTPLVWKHGLHKEVFRYVFETHDRKVMWGLTPSNKEKAVRFNQHIGFREVYRIEDGFEDGIDLIVFRMNRDECKYIGQRHGQQHRNAA